MRSSAARSSTSFSPPAMHTATHVPQPTTSTFWKPSSMASIWSRGFLSATIMLLLLGQTGMSGQTRMSAPPPVRSKSVIRAANRAFGNGGCSSMGLASFRPASCAAAARSGFGPSLRTRSVISLARWANKGPADAGMWKNSRRSGSRPTSARSFLAWATTWIARRFPSRKWQSPFAQPATYTPSAPSSKARSKSTASILPVQRIFTTRTFGA